MNHVESIFKNANSKDTYRQSWLPEGEAHAALVIVHGSADHSGRYMSIVDRFVSRGFAVHGFDLDGQGRSGGKRAHIERFTDFVDTLDDVLTRVKGRHPGRRVFLVGHSLGGMVCVRHLALRPGAAAGAVLSGTLVTLPPSFPKVLIPLTRIIGALAPRLRIGDPGASGFCRDPAVVAAYDGDPHVCREFLTAGFAAELFKAMKQLPSDARCITAPVLVLQGGADVHVDPAGAQILYDNLATTAKALKVYEGLSHEVFNEPEKERVLDDTQSWLESVLQD